MESDGEDDMLYYSHQKLSNLIHQKGNKNEAIKEYLDNLKYQPIKDFEKNLEWFNVSEPLSFNKYLKGKVVVLDFFTYCCINCMHIIPDLREIEKEFSVEDGLVVVGVHSAKFENEKKSINILAAVQRYNITHPVVNDYNCQMWKNCEVRCWPTLLVLGPNANPIVMLMGEGHKENLRIYIKSSLEYYKSKKQISNHKIPFKSAYHFLPDLKGPLLFPGKITNFVNKKNEEVLAVSDTGNNRIIIFEPNGKILLYVGSGKSGLKDGDIRNCEMNAPQGLVFQNEDTIFVADTENHSIRKIDLKNKLIETVVGTGIQGNDYVGGNQWTQQAISSPWDLCLYRTPDMDMTFYPNGNPPLKDVLIIAMAGTHQIWALFLEDTVWWKCKKYAAGTCLCIAGSGKEENRNNAYPHTASFAQPSGLALCQKTKQVYIADSESSTVRRLSLVDGKVTPVVGGDKNPNNLFAFGDKDGSLCDAKLQHLLGLALSKDEEILLVADTYNHKLKKVNINQNFVSTLVVQGDLTDGKNVTFNEPGGLCFSADGTKIFLADTNNHCVKVLTFGTNYCIKSSKTLFLLDSMETTIEEKVFNQQTIKAQSLTLGDQGGKIIINFTIEFSEDLKLAEAVPQKWSIKMPDITWSSVPTDGDVNHIEAVVNVPKGKGGAIQFIFDLVTCTVEACLPKKFIVQIPVILDTSNTTNAFTVIRIVLNKNETILN